MPSFLLGCKAKLYCSPFGLMLIYNPRSLLGFSLGSGVARKLPEAIWTPRAIY